jgi:hypothetical protein
MKNFSLITSAMLLLFLFSTQGCHKDVISEQDTNPATSDLVKNFVSDTYFAQANKYYNPSGENKIQSRTIPAQVDAVKDFFISHTSVVLNLVNSIGYPVWNESIASEIDGDELLILPFSKLDTNRIDAVMLIHRPEGSESMYFKTIRRDALHSLSGLSSLTLDENEKYSELSREFATTMVLYFEYAIFTEVDCNLANSTFGNPLSDPILESRGTRCYYVEYVQEIQYWNRYAGGVMIYQESTFRYSWELVCDQIMDPGAFVGGGGSWGYDPGGSTGSGNNNNSNNSGPTLADCRQSNPDVLKRIFELSSQKLVSACHKGRSINFDWNYIEKELCKTGKYDLNGLKDYVNKILEKTDYLDNRISNPRLNCLWERLMKNNNKVLCEQISYFEGPTKLNLSVWSTNFTGAFQSNAVTDLDQNGQVAIQFNQNNLKDKCDIEIIKTMIHETVHAGILNVVLGTHINGWGIDNIPGLRNYYDNYSDFHHEYMAGVYFENLVQGLRNYFGNEYSDEIYRAITWSGLHNTKAYKQLSEIERAKIELIWKNFEQGTTCKKSCL